MKKPICKCRTVIVVGSYHSAAAMVGKANAPVPVKCSDGGEGQCTRTLEVQLKDNTDSPLTPNAYSQSHLCRTAPPDFSTGHMMSCMIQYYDMFLHNPAMLSPPNTRDVFLVHFCFLFLFLTFQEGCHSQVYGQLQN